MLKYTSSGGRATILAVKNSHRCGTFCTDRNIMICNDEKFEMEKIRTRMKGWIKNISTLNLEGIADELAEIFPDKNRMEVSASDSEEIDNSLFKLLLYLSHAAHDCERTKITTGLEIYKLAHCVCVKMNTVQDSKRAFSAIFHITKCLLEMKQYKQAMDFFIHVFPERRGRLFSENEELYRKSSSLWKAIICNGLLNKTDLTSDKTIVILLDAMKIEFDATKLAFRDYSIAILEKICFYCKQVKSVTKRSEESILGEKFETFALYYLKTCNIILTETSRYQIFKTICIIIAEFISRDLNGKTIELIGPKTNLYFEPFVFALEKDEFCRGFFNLYRRFSELFLKPMRNFSKTPVQDIDSCEFNIRSIMNDNNDREAIKSLLHPASVVFSTLLTHWEETAKNKISSIPLDLIAASFRFFLAFAGLHSLRGSSSCRCNSETCVAEFDHYSAVLLISKCLAVASRIISQQVTSEELNQVLVHCAVESVDSIIVLKENGCRKWSDLWASVGAYIYNIAISCETSNYDSSVRLHSLLCQNMIRLEGLDPPNPIIKLADPLREVLHRLTSVHYNNRYYDEAAIVCSLNGLLSCEKTESRPYRYWANIKRNDAKSLEQPMLNTLRSNSKEIEQIANIDLKNYNQVQVCLREIKGLQESTTNLMLPIIASLREMSRLNASASAYAQGVHLLGYHLLNFKPFSSIEKYVKKAIWQCERDSQLSVSGLWSYGHLHFFKFTDRLYQITEKTENEMKIKAAVPPASSDEIDPDKAPDLNVVPTYSTTNLSLTIELHDLLKLALQKWIEAFHSGFKGILEDWEASQALHIVTIAGEYARLFNLDDVAMLIWRLAYVLATKLNNDRSIIYITSRCLLGEHIDSLWIERADKIVESMEKNGNKELIARYQYCLALFYFKSNRHDEAMEYYRRAQEYIGLDFLSDNTTHTIRNDIILNFVWDDYCSDDFQLEYQTIIVEILYGMLTMTNELSVRNFYGKKEKKISDYIMLFDTANSFAMRINSILGHQEISLHLAQRLTAAQEFGAALRVAQVLKTLCYIDLSRAKLNECEAKLIGIEQILRIRADDSPPLPTITPLKEIKRTKDIGQNDASPILRKNRFVTPSFILHKDTCQCFECANEEYQYLVFASTYIRAQFYSLRGNAGEAFYYFNGGFDLWENVFGKISVPDEDEKTVARRITSFQLQDKVLEFVMFQLDYCRFLKFNMPNAEEMFEYSNRAKNFCEAYWLTNHPIYMSVNEFIVECQFEATYTPDMFSSFIVPHPDEMDVSPYVDNLAEPTIPFATPTRNTVAKEAKGVNRKKQQPFLKLNKVPLDFEDKEEPPISTSPVLSAAKRVRRKISNPDAPNSKSKSLVPEIKLTTENDKSAKKSGSNIDDPCSSSVSVPLASDDDDELSHSSENSEQMKRLINRMKHLEVQTPKKMSTRTQKKSQQEPVASTSREGMDNMEELFVEMTMNKQETSSLASQSRSSKNRKPAKNSDCGRAKKSSKEIEIITLSSDSEDEGKRKSARLRKKSEDSTIAKSGSSKSLDKAGRCESNSESEDLVITAKTRKRVASKKST